ncbi:MAG TPA: FtsX-like permease family protein [Sedimentisphaerales bacterium]|nr:FtsX-like permease family protein [Sedimentisphaerales bacterium]
MLKLFLWFRYLRKKKIVLLSITAVALSTALLIVVSSLFTSFIRAFEQAAVEAVGDVVLTPPIRVGGYPLFIERLEKMGAVETATATLSGQGLLHLGRGNVRAVKIWGIEPGERAKVTGLKESLRRQSRLPGEPSFEVPGSPEKVGGYVGIGVVGAPDEKTDEYDFGAIENDMIGRDVVLVTGTEIESGGPEGASESSSSDSAAGGGKKFRRKNIPFAISDIVFTGVYPLDKDYVYLPIAELQKRLYPDEARPVADQIQIKLAAGVRTDAALAEIRGVWADFAEKQLGWGSHLIAYTDIETAREMQERYVAELLKQMWVLLFIFGVVSFGVVLLVFCIFYMIVGLKRKDIAIVKSCGATSSTVALIFVGFGACVGIIGSAAGTVVAYIVTKNINAIEQWIRIIFGLKLWKSSVYMFSKIPNAVNWDSALLIVLSAVIAVTVGALIPALIAAGSTPVNILRYE